MRLIDADALKNALIECTPYAIDPVYRNTNSNIDMFTVMELLDELPTIDAVPVVRCGECLSAKWYESGDFYCQKWGERCDNPYTLTGQSKTDFCSHGSKEECKEE